MDESELQPGMTVVGEKTSYLLDLRLGGGKYAEVWLARVPEDVFWLEVEGAPSRPVDRVAIKAMKPGLTEEEQRHFWSEIEVLRSLQRYEQQHGLREGGPSRVPTVFEFRDQDPPFYFSITLAPGQPLDELMRERGAFQEAEAVHIVGQLCRVLRALHGAENCSYLDFQPKNVFYDRQNGEILVIDWNLLSTKSEARFEQDTLAAGSLLYRLLMGVPAPLPGSRRSLAQPVDQWQCLSLPAQELLSRALQPDQTRRYEDPHALQKDLDQLLELWQRPASDLVSSAAVLIPAGGAGRALRSDDKQRVRQAAQLLSVASKSGSLSPSAASQSAELTHQIADWMAGKGHLSNGLRLFDAGDYQAALQDFQAAIDEAWDARAALTAARWVQVVQAGQQMTLKYEQLDRTQVKRAIDSLQRDSFEEACAALEPLAGKPGGEPIGHLVSEAKVWTGIRQAEAQESEQRFGAAAETLRQAADLQAGLPYGGLLREALGDIGARVAMLEEQASRFQTARGQAGAIDSAFARAFAEGYGLLRDQLESHPGHPELLGLARDRTQSLLQAGRHDQARALAALALDYSLRWPHRDSLQELHQVASTLAEAETARRFHDLVRLSSALQGMPESELGGVHLARIRRQASQLEEHYDDEFASDMEQVDIADRLAEEARDLDVDDPERPAKVGQALSMLAEAREIVVNWAGRSGLLGWSQYLEDLDLLDQELKVISSSLQESRTEGRVRELQVIATLWPLVLEGPAPMSEASAAADGAAPDAALPALCLPAGRRIPLLEQVVASFDALLQSQPGDPEAPQWRTWRDTAAIELEAQRTAQAAELKEAKQKRWPRWVRRSVSERPDIREGAASRALTRLRSAVEEKRESDIESEPEEPPVQEPEATAPETVPSPQSDTLPPKPGPRARWESASEAGNRVLGFLRKRWPWLAGGVAAAAVIALCLVVALSPYLRQKVVALIPQRPPTATPTVLVSPPPTSIPTPEPTPLPPTPEDTDGDGLADELEVQLGTDSHNKDTDNDGLDDGVEHEGKTDPTKADTDGDGLNDPREIELGTDPGEADSDGDGLSDYDEIEAHKTTATDADSDDDGLNDYDEVITHGTEPMSPDSDNDGLDDGDEISTHNTDPMTPDSDDDGLEDGAEVNTHGTDPTSGDTDEDGVSDGEEVNAGTNPLSAEPAKPVPGEILFPAESATFAVMPWQIVIGSPVPASVTLLLEPLFELEAPVDITLGQDTGAVLQGGEPLTLASAVSTEVLAAGGHEYLWQRTVDDLRELPDGKYLLTALLDAEADSGYTRASLETQFSLDSSLAVAASVARTQGGVSHRSLPQANPMDQSLKLQNGGEVDVLGHLAFVGREGNVLTHPKWGIDERWCLYEVPDESQRRSWIWCYYLGALDQAWTDPLPSIAPPQQPGP